MFKLKADHIRLVCYLFAFAAALYYPVKKIMDFEFPSVPPKVYYFKTELYDPYDPMRGHYVQLSLSNQQVHLTHKNINITTYKQSCFAELETDPGGNARIVNLYQTKKEVPRGKDILRVSYLGFHHEWDPKTQKMKKTGYHSIGLPFNRFYMNEKLAPEAEKLIQKYTRKGEARLKVRIFPDGSFAVDDLLIQGKPIRDLLRGK